MNYKAILTIVPRGEGEKMTHAAVKGGARGGTVLLGKGTANSSVLQFLGLGETAKDITMTIIEEEHASQALNAIKEAAGTKRHYGIAFTINVGNFARSGTDNQNEENRKMISHNYRMINVIVNRGYAEDAIAAARSAGASGGTILQARGTAKEDDASFFGVQLVPEKEMLIIVVDEAKYEAVYNAIRELKCFKEKGSGIEFSLPVEDFTVLGQD